MSISIRYPLPQPEREEPEPSQIIEPARVDPVPTGRIMSSLVAAGGLASEGGIAGKGGGLAG